MFERYTESARKAVFIARFEASRCGAAYIEAEHLLLGILREGTELTQRLLLTAAKVQAIREQVEKRYPVRKSVSTSVDLPLSTACKRALGYAAEEAETMKHKHIGPEHLLLGLAREESGIIKDILRENAITVSLLRSEALLADVAPRAPQRDAMPRAVTGGRDLTRAARDGTLGTLVGRERELERVIHILSRRTKNSCALIGDAGVGKTAIVEGLAQKIARGHVPATIAERRLIALDASSLVTSRHRGRSSDWLDDILGDSVDTILFIRGLFNLAVAGSAWPVVEAMHALGPHLSRGVFQCIATGSSAGLRETIEKAGTLARHFEIVDVAPVNEEDAIRIVSSLKGQFERFHEVVFGEGVIEKAVYASGRVLPDRNLPDRAIDLLDEAAVAVRLRRGNEPHELADVRKKLRQHQRAMENAIANHEFELARQHSAEARNEEQNLERLREQHKLNDTANQTVTPKDIEAAAVSRTGMSPEAVRNLLQKRDAGELRRIIAELCVVVPVDAREWVVFLAAYLVQCSAVEAGRLAQAIIAAKPQG